MEAGLRQGQFPLEAIAARAAVHPFYAGLPSGGVLLKADLYVAVESALRDRRAEVVNGVYWSPSGGTSSGVPLYFPTDTAENHAQRRLLAEDMRSFDIFDARTVAVILHGGSHMYRSLEIFTELVELCGGTPLPLGYSCDNKTVVEMARRFGANTLTGTPSRIAQLAQYVISTGNDVRFEHIHYSSEAMSQARLDFIQEALGPARITSVYGSAETGVYAFKPADVPINQFIFDARGTHIDIVHDDDENNDDVSSGNIVVTCLTRWKNPVVRYRTGDVGSIVPIDVELAKKAGVDPGAYKVLQFRNRVSSSFQIASDYIDLGDIEPTILQHALDYQIVLTRADNYDYVDFVIVRADDAELEASEYVFLDGEPSRPSEYYTKGIVSAHKDLLDKLATLLSIGDAQFYFRVRAVKQSALRRTAHSTKVIRIVDERV